MASYDTYIEGNSKRIFSASPLQVSSLKKQYLRLMSPGKIPEVLKQVEQLPNIVPGFCLKRSKLKPIVGLKQGRRKASLTFNCEYMQTRQRAKTRTKSRKVVMKEKLRLNNL
ncbi:hypothetical protein SteCoe_3074 [Stentor coeruleus]|uniref:Uncharacterized protein n=1 Tax=Stentor coeruleus TaxID=5963 RepID=A0A1R2CY42_9CILI|nr:hypothetical protein SteCoe_3074 [Stentor coeruleus]